MGCPVSSSIADGFSVVQLSPLTNPLRPLQMTLPGDLSSAAFLIVAALLLPGSDVTIHNVGLNPTRTGLLDVLQSMGADLDVKVLGEQAGEPYGEIRAKASSLLGTEVCGDFVVRMIDEFPIFAVAACCAEGITRVRDAAELRVKESDRISDLAFELKSLGAEIVESPDGFEISGPCPLRGGAARPHGDHRLAMSLLVAGLAGQGPVEVEGAEIIQESFPGFAEIFNSLGKWSIIRP
jgi:3-phosphoshikimate 1-carboxyvinyltransferase